MNVLGFSDLAEISFVRNYVFHHCLKVSGLTPLRLLERQTPETLLGTCRNDLWISFVLGVHVDFFRIAESILLNT